MTQDQIILMAILAATVGLFVWGRWRHDLVALAALLACVLAGLVAPADAFMGFGHPAVITVACVLVLSGALISTGAIDALARRVAPAGLGPLATMASLTALAALLSAFMNNVGALALLMPVAVMAARRLEIPAGRLLMPLSFGSILGGMTTMIGTPPNLIVAGFREQAGPASFAMFDFAPVGLAVAGAGIAFMLLAGWRLVPARQAGQEGFEIGAYLTEARVPARAKAIGMTLREIEKEMEKAEAQVVGLIRDETRIPAPGPWRKVRAKDILVIEAEPDGLVSALSALGLKLEEDKKQEAREAVQSDEIRLAEMAVRPDSPFVGRSAADVRLRNRYGVNLLAVSRQGRRSMARLRTLRVAAGDVLLLQGAPEALSEFAAQFDCVPLAERALRIPSPRKALLAVGIFAAAIAAAAAGLVPAALSFAAGVLAVVVSGILPVRNMYSAIDWPVIVLLGALLPVAAAMADTGAAQTIAAFLINAVAQGHPAFALALILVVTMTLSDFMNNAATAAVMCPIAIGAAMALDVNPDAFLMAVAVGASCAFLTPIGHQNNTLILGPGGFRFGDYWRLGLPMEVVVVAAGVPMLLWIWPL
ncbi:MAG: SLC13 family permease [Maricaulaceae bacterium]|nr:SLC13 family permease [Maricaulaceae bacterium]